MSSQEEMGSKSSVSREGTDEDTTDEGMPTHFLRRRSGAIDDSTEKQIFEGLCFYLNGSTAPLISDHKLKHLLSAHGDNHSIAPGRRAVTHIILGTQCGGSLSVSKLQKESGRRSLWRTSLATTMVQLVDQVHERNLIDICRVLSSIAASKRQPESHFQPLKLAPTSQNSLFLSPEPAKPPAG
ncbi:hypothetical protein K458DRAFT_385495 [Lentithecium fluviatile CBS 122367]|uniref:BRCT domain-containing protein n=1 Tax=Lentithecium fluviatile CBS 122367 TaxID=1168545 RepID=A0A6G1JCI6_9PLEO|nr:hypothetical protein K458DRAFT_385495 [Lentithecium fluviatile CBS 122367]